MDFDISDYDLDGSSAQMEVFRKDMEVHYKALRYCQSELAEAASDQDKHNIRKAIADCRLAMAEAFERETVLLNEARNGGQFQSLEA